MQVVVGKSLTGEFVVGKLEEKDGKPILTEVYNIIFHEDRNNQMRPMIIPMMAPFDNKAVKEVSVDNFVLTMIEAPESVQQAYIKLTTGLDVVSSGNKIIQ